MATLALMTALWLTHPGREHAPLVLLPHLKTGAAIVPQKRQQKVVKGKWFSGISKFTEVLRLVQRSSRPPA